MSLAVLRFIDVNHSLTAPPVVFVLTHMVGVSGDAEGISTMYSIPLTFMISPSMSSEGVPRPVGLGISRHTGNSFSNSPSSGRREREPAASLPLESSCLHNFAISFAFTAPEVTAFGPKQNSSESAG